MISQAANPAPAPASEPHPSIGTTCTATAASHRPTEPTTETTPVVAESTLTRAKTAPPSCLPADKRSRSPCVTRPERAVSFVPRIRREGISGPAQRVVRRARRTRRVARFGRGRRLFASPSRCTARRSSLPGSGWTSPSPRRRTTRWRSASGRSPGRRRPSQRTCERFPAAQPRLSAVVLRRAAGSGHPATQHPDLVEAVADWIERREPAWVRTAADDTVDRVLDYVEMLASGVGVDPVDAA